MGSLLFVGCNNAGTIKTVATETAANEAPEYFNLRPKLEKEYGYTHAIKIGSAISPYFADLNKQFLNFSFIII